MQERKGNKRKNNTFDFKGATIKDGGRLEEKPFLLYVVEK
jgi:hypothetical protein